MCGHHICGSESNDHLHFLHVKFGTVEAIQNHKSATLVKSIKSLVQAYKTSGFQAMPALMDGKFRHLQGELANMG